MTTISVNHTRRFRDNDIAEKIFQEILRQAVEKKLAEGEILYTDSTHVKAKANKHKKTTVTIEKTPKAYMEEMDAVIAADRDALGKKPFDKKVGVTYHVWQDDLEQADTFTKTYNGKRIYARRKQTSERSFAEDKEPHALRYFPEIVCP